MKILTNEAIKSLGISPKTCVQWVKESFASKASAQLPPKLSVHPKGYDFITTMPCLMAQEEGLEQRFGVKVVHRLDGCTPSLGSDIMLYSARTGELLALLDGEWITTMRTGAVATYAIQTFAKKGSKVMSFMGLGNTARATLLCLLSTNFESRFHVKLLRYKNQAELFVERFKDFKNVEFEICEEVEQMISASDVIISCITQATQNICEDDGVFKPGCLVVPVHTRGFQNCDLTFDKVFGDDTAHVCGFKYFNQFKFFGELQDVVDGKIEGRTTNEERILSYNIGLGLHDSFFANKIYDLSIDNNLQTIEWQKGKKKFWV